MFPYTNVEEKMNFMNIQTDPNPSSVIFGKVMLNSLYFTKWGLQSQAIHRWPTSRCASWDCPGMLSVCYPRVNSCWVKKPNQTWHSSVTSSTSNISRCLNGSLTKHHAFHFFVVCWHSNHPLRSYVIIFSSSSFLQRKNARDSLEWICGANLGNFPQKRPSMEGISESKVNIPLWRPVNLPWDMESHRFWNRVAIFTASGGLSLNECTFIFQMSGFGVEILDIFGGVGCLGSRSSYLGEHLVIHQYMYTIRHHWLPQIMSRSF